MFGSTALDVVIGLVFVFLLYSLLASILQEIFSTWMGLRARILKKAIVRMLNDNGTDPRRPLKWYRFLFWFLNTFVWKRVTSFYRVLIQRDPPEGTLARSFYEHPLIKYLGENTYNSKPAYLSAKNFSKVMVDLITGMKNKAGSDYAVEIQTFMDPDSEKVLADNDDEHPLKAPEIPKGDTTKTVEVQKDTYVFLQSLWADAQGDLTRFKALLEGWYDDTMERTTGWYKQYTQFFLFLIGFSIAVAFNVDAIRISQKLASDPELREQVVQQADAFVKAHPNLDAELKEARRAATDSTDASQAQVDSVQALLDKQDTLMARANRLVSGDIQNLNQVLGLGYDPVEGRFFSCHNLQRFCRGFFSREGLIRTVGWILTALAISLGAPFWFDLLNKLMQLRGTVKKSGSGGGGTESPHPADNPIIRKG